MDEVPRLERLSTPPSVAMTDVESFVQFLVVRVESSCDDPFFKGCSQDGRLGNLRSYLKSFLRVLVARTTLRVVRAQDCGDPEITVDLDSKESPEGHPLEEAISKEDSQGGNQQVAAGSGDTVVSPQRLSKRTIERVIRASRRFLERLAPFVGGAETAQDVLKYEYAVLMCRTVGDEEEPKLPPGYDPTVHTPFTGIFRRFLKRVVLREDVSVAASLLQSKKGWPELPEVRRIEALEEHLALITNREHDDDPEVKSLASEQAAVVTALGGAVRLISGRNLAPGKPLPRTFKFLPSASASYEVPQAKGGAAALFPPLVLRGFYTHGNDFLTRFVEKRFIDEAWESRVVDPKTYQGLVKQLRKGAQLTLEAKTEVTGLRPVQLVAPWRRPPLWTELPQIWQRWPDEEFAKFEFPDDFKEIEIVADPEPFGPMVRRKVYDVRPLKPRFLNFKLRPYIEEAERELDSWLGDVTRQLQSWLSLNDYLDDRAPSVDHPVTVMAIAEPSKFRIITKGPSLLYTALQPLQSDLLSWWKNSGVSTMKTDLLTRVNEMYEGTPSAWSWYSVDYKSATDFLWNRMSYKCLDAINHWHPVVNYELGQNSFRPAEVHYPGVEVDVTHVLPIVKERLSSLSEVSAFLIYREGEAAPEVASWSILSDLDSISKKVLEGRMKIVLNIDERVRPQTNGQLMGHPLSFPLLCLANLAVYVAFTDWWFHKLVDQIGTEREVLSWWVKQDPKLRLFAGLQSLRNHLLRNVLVNGDDMLFRAPKSISILVNGQVQEIDLRKRFGEFSLSVGLKPSLGKNYRSTTFAMINSKYFCLDPKAGKMREESYLNPKIVLGLSLKTGVSEATPAGLSREMNRMFHLAPWTRGVLPGSMRRFVDKFYRPGQTPNWFIPVHLGGCGIEPGLFEGLLQVKVTREQRKVAAYMLRNPLESLFKSGVRGCPGWVVEKFATNPEITTSPNRPEQEEEERSATQFERMTLLFQLTQLGLGNPKPAPSMWWPRKEDFGNLHPMKVSSFDKHWYQVVKPLGGIPPRPLHPITFHDHQPTRLKPLRYVARLVPGDLEFIGQTPAWWLQTSDKIRAEVLSISNDSLSFNLEQFKCLHLHVGDRLKEKRLE